MQSERSGFRPDTSSLVIFKKKLQKFLVDEKEEIFEQANS